MGAYLPCCWLAQMAACLDFRSRATGLRPCWNSVLGVFILVVVVAQSASARAHPACLSFKNVCELDSALARAKAQGECCHGLVTCAPFQDILPRVAKNCQEEAKLYYEARLQTACSSSPKSRRMLEHGCEEGEKCVVETPSSCEPNTYSVTECSKEFGAGYCLGDSSNAFEVPFYSNVYDNASAYRVQYGCCTGISLMIENSKNNQECVNHGLPVVFEENSPSFETLLIAENWDTTWMNMTNVDGKLEKLSVNKVLTNTTTSPWGLSLKLNYTTVDTSTKSHIYTTGYVKHDGEYLNSVGGLHLFEEHGFKQSLMLANDLKVEEEVDGAVEVYQMISAMNGLKSSDVDVPEEGDLLGTNRFLNCSSTIYTPENYGYIQCDIDEAVGTVQSNLETGVMTSEMDVFFEVQSVLYQENRRRRRLDVMQNESCFGFLACIALADATTFLNSNYSYDVVDDDILMTNLNQGIHAFRQEEGSITDADIFVTVETPRLEFETGTTKTFMQTHQSRYQIDPPEIVEGLYYYIGEESRRPPARRLVDNDSLGVRNRTNLQVVMMKSQDGSSEINLPTLSEESYENSEEFKFVAGIPVTECDEIELQWWSNFTAETIDGVFERLIYLELNKTGVYEVSATSAEFCLKDYTLQGGVSGGVCLFGASNKAHVNYSFAQLEQGKEFSMVHTSYTSNFTTTEPYAAHEVLWNESLAEYIFMSTIGKGKSDFSYTYLLGERNGSVTVTEESDFFSKTETPEQFMYTPKGSRDFSMSFPATSDGNSGTSLTILDVKEGVPSEADCYGLRIDLFKAPGSAPVSFSAHVDMEKLLDELYVETTSVTTETWLGFQYKKGNEYYEGYQQVFEKEVTIIDLTKNSTNPFVPTPSPTTLTPSVSPTKSVAPTVEPTTAAPTTAAPTTAAPTTAAPTTAAPTTAAPTTAAPTTAAPTTTAPTTIAPTGRLTSLPTKEPTPSPTERPSAKPTATAKPTPKPTKPPKTEAPTRGGGGWVRGRRLRPNGSRD